MKTETKKEYKERLSTELKKMEEKEKQAKILLKIEVMTKILDLIKQIQ